MFVACCFLFAASNSSIDVCWSFIVCCCFSDMLGHPNFIMFNFVYRCHGRRTSHLRKITSGAFHNALSEMRLCHAKKNAIKCCSLRSEERKRVATSTSFNRPVQSHNPWVFMILFKCFVRCGNEKKERERVHTSHFPIPSP